MNRAEIYAKLMPLSDFVQDPDVGHVMRKEAWENIDFLLDELIEIQQVSEIVL